jgi:hypothetical protein
MNNSTFFVFHFCMNVSVCLIEEGRSFCQGMEPSCDFITRKREVIETFISKVSNFLIYFTFYIRGRPQWSTGRNSYGISVIFLLLFNTPKNLFLRVLGIWRYA